MIRKRSIKMYFSDFNSRSELMIVNLIVSIYILAILTVIVVFYFSDMFKNVKSTESIANSYKINSVFEIYYVTSVGYPSDIFQPFKGGGLTHILVPQAFIKDNDGTVYEIPPYVICTFKIVDKASYSRAIVKVGSCYYDVEHLKSELKW